MYARIWYEPDGVKVQTFAPGLPLADQLAACETLLRDGRVHAASTWEDVATPEELRALLPPDRSARHKWRKGARGVVVDPRVPDLPDSRALLRAQVEAARSIEDVKAVLREVLK